MEKVTSPEIKAVLFDLDDTLYEEMKFVEGGFQAVALFISKNSNIRQDVCYRLLLEVLKEHGRGHTFNIALKKLGLYEKELVSKLIEIYHTHKPNLSLYSEAKSVLFRLKETGYKLGLITDGNVRVQKSKITALGIDGFFNCIIVSDEYGPEKRKPHVFPYERSLKKLGVSPGESVYIGDNPAKDFVAAKKLGMYTIRVMTGQHKMVKTDSEYEADIQISTLREVPDVLNEINKTTQRKIT